MAEMKQESDLENHAQRAQNVVRLKTPAKVKAQEITTFDRRELDLILRIYGTKVADGEWRDYAIDMLTDHAVFSVFKRTGDVPLYRIEKTPKLAMRQGIYSVSSPLGQILKRGDKLSTVLKFLERKPKLYPV